MNQSVIIDFEREFLDIREKYEQECKLAQQLELMLERAHVRIATLESELADTRKVDMIERQCVGCGETFEQPVKSRKRKYCSNACKQSEYRYKRDSKLMKLTQV